MRITRAEAYLCDVPVERERRDAVQAFIKQETIIVEVVTDDGLSGRGYSYTIGTGGRAVLSLLRDELLPQLSGDDPRRVEAIWQKLFWSTHATVVGPLTSLALAAVDTALWDVRCHAAGLPLWVLAGGYTPRVKAYDTEGGWLQLRTDELVTGAIDAQKRGFDGVKLKIGKPTGEEDRQRVSAVREAVGPTFPIMVDANQAFTVAEARRRARLLEPLDVAWLEEPLPAEDLSGHARLAAATSIPVAVGESLYSCGHFRDYLAAGAAGIVQVDVARIGGITPWLKVAHLADAFNVKVAPHFLMELHLSLAAAISNSLPVEHIQQLRALVLDDVLLDGGWLHAPDRVGIGIAWDDDALDRHRVA